MPSLLIESTDSMIYNKKYFSDDHFSCHYMRAWIRVMDTPSCYERVSRAERKSTLQGSGLVRTVGPCAQRRVALMPRAIAIARDALSNDRCESAACFERPAKQVLALATKPQAK